VRFDGAVIAAASEGDAAALQARAMQTNRAVMPLSPQQAGKRAGLKAALAHALFVTDEGVADPLWTLSGLTLEARGHGVTIAYDQDVSSASAHRVETFTGEVYEADHIVLAPGAWGSVELMNAAPALKRIRPAKGHLVSVKTAKPLKANLHTPGFYMTRRRDDVVLGASMQFDRYDRGVEQSQVQKLLAAGEAAAPGQIKPTGRAWAGIRPMSPDGWPLIGRSNGILVAAGQSRNGWVLAPITAEIITAYVFGAELSPAWAALSPQRFEP
jgi:glycine oxidase